MRNPSQARNETIRRDPDRVLGHVLLAVLVVLIFAGAAARVHDLGYPGELTWDEHHFVENARNLLGGRSDWNDHPPLGKLLIASGMLVAGDDSTGWRLAPLVMGLALIVLAYLLASHAFRSLWAGLLAAAFIAADGFTLAYSKTALLDGMLATTMVAAALFAWRARSSTGVVIAGAFVGLSMSIKFSGAVMLIPLMLVVLFRFGVEAKSVGLVLAGMLAAGATYVTQFMVGLTLANDPNGLLDIARKTTELVQHHLALTDWKHPQTSRWYPWFVPLKRLTLHYAREGNTVRALLPSGHPVLWWGVNLTLLWTIVDAVRRKPWRRTEHGEHARAEATPRYYLWMLWFLPLLPWILSNRDSYLYHYLPSYVFGLVLFAGVVSTFERKKALAFAVLVAAVFAFCAPVWSKIPFSADSLLYALFFPGRG